MVKIFNINTMFKYLAESLNENCRLKSTNLVFMFSKSVPCKMKGDVSTLYIIFFKILQKILKNDCNSEIVISIDAPEVFLYKELVTFKITNIPIKIEQIIEQLNEILFADLTKINASLGFHNENGGSIVITVPLTNGELGSRRHYRVSSTKMLHKNILLIVKSSKLSLSLTKMFRYFPMNVDLCIKTYKQDKYDMSAYDLILIEDALFDFQIYDLVKEAKEQSNVQFVLLGDEDIYQPEDNTKLHTSFLKKPVTQEAVFELIVSLFSDSATLA